MDNVFFENLNIGQFFRDFFNDSDDFFVFAKDKELKFRLMNRALRERIGLANFSDVIGKDDYAFFQSNLVELFRQEDMEVINQKKSKLNVPWSVPNGRGGLDWYISSKYPLFDHFGEVVGLLGVMRGVNKAGSILEPYTQLSKVILYVQKNFSQQIDVEYLAGLANFSVSQFERNFKKLLNMTPLKFINKVRLDNACELLISTRKGLSEISSECGFYDHSYFTKVFKQQMGMTPMIYRQKHFRR